MNDQVIHLVHAVFSWGFPHLQMLWMFSVSVHHWTHLSPCSLWDPSTHLPIISLSCFYLIFVFRSLMTIMTMMTIAILKDFPLHFTMRIVSSNTVCRYSQIYFLLSLSSISLTNVLFFSPNEYIIQWWLLIKSTCSFHHVSLTSRMLIFSCSSICFILLFLTFWIDAVLLFSHSKSQLHNDTIQKIKLAEKVNSYKTWRKLILYYFIILKF